MIFTLKFCIVNRENRKDLYSKNDAKIYTEIYSDLENSGKYDQLASWSLVQTMEKLGHKKKKYHSCLPKSIQVSFTE